ncbi:hypothetical protein [Nonomuraea zeae]|uniref:Uncharacterized protein n=1 Tax=Nonomuraea zeae TaxID=1642303 RepID=A0A5S4GVS1_9ACTN|nr:hypothetical protein [Nonomuraea zeae]TMR36859.1 hypothetical protein ETD85_09810 [Nonomuraea zeae]
MRPVMGMGIGMVAALVVGLSAPAAATAVRTTASGPSPDEWKKVTSLRILPDRPRQNNDVRLFIHCPTTANHVIIGSTAFNLMGSTRLYREVGESLSDRGLARRTVSISYYALPGHHQVHMKCVLVTMNKKTRIRKIKVISRCTVPIVVRRFRLAQFFA